MRFVPDYNLTEPRRLDQPQRRPVLPDPMGLLSLDDMARRRLDVLVIGSGAGGSAAAWRLAVQYGLNVGVLEGGPVYLLSHARNVPILTNDPHHVDFLNERVTRGINRFFPDLPQAHIMENLGGRTVFWALRSPRLAPEDFREWPITAAEMAPYYDLAEEMLTITSEHSTGSALRAEVFHRLTDHGHGEVRDMPLSWDTRPSTNGYVAANVAGSAFNFLVPAILSGRCRVAVNAKVAQLEFDGDRSVAAVVLDASRTGAPRQVEVTARAFIVACSTIETPRLLFNSGLRSEALGAYLIDHTTVDATVELDRALPGFLAARMPRTAQRLFQVGLYGGLFHRFLPPVPTRSLFLHSFGIMVPEARNRVYVDPKVKDYLGIPVAKVAFSFSDRDMAVVKEMSAEMLQIAGHLGAEVVTPPHLKGAGSSFHEAGTARIGRDPRTSVIDENCRVHGFKNLYVADNSVFPTGGAGNPTLTCAALAIRTADRVRAHLGR